MYRFFIALALLLVTGYLAVADLLSSLVLQAVFFFSALSVICHLYVYTADFVQRIVTMHNCHERVNSETPHLKSYSDFYALAILQIGARWLGRSLKEVIYETCRASLPILLATINRMPTPVGTTLNRLKPYRDWLPYSTPRLVVALICLGYLTFWALSLVLKHVVARLAGLALCLRNTCTPTTTACLSIIVCLYVYSSHELRKTVANFIAPINSMIPFKLSPLDCDVLYDREYDDIPDLELEDVSKNVNHPPAPQPQAWQPLPHSTVIPTSPVRSQTPLSESDDGTTAGSRPLPRDDLAELAAQALRRMREAAQAELAAALAANKASNSNQSAGVYHTPPSFRSSSSPTFGYNWSSPHWNGTSLGATSTPDFNISAPRGSIQEYGRVSSPIAVAQQPSYTGTFSNPHVDLPAPTTASSSHASLPALDRDALTSDDSSELDTSADERAGSTKTCIVRPTSKTSSSSLKRIRGLITRVRSKTSPMYAPKEIVDAQLASGEDKPAAALVRSQWKSKQNWVIPSKTKVKKVKAPTAAPTVVSPIPQPEDTNSGLNKPASSEKPEQETHLVLEPQGDSNTSGSTPMPSPVVSSPVVPSPVQAPSLVPTVEVPVTTVEDLSRVRIVKVLPSCKAAPLRTDAPPTTMAIPPAPPAPAKPSRPQPLTATRTISSINDLKQSKATGLRSLSSTVAMTPRELAEAMNKRANKASGSGIRKVRIAPVYTLLDEKRTVVQKGQRIPPNTQYQVKDEKGTSLRITGARGMLV